MSISVSTNINTETGVYIELECTEDTKKRLHQYVTKYIDKNSNYNDFHLTLIYSKKKFSGNIEYTIGMNLKKVFAKPVEFVKFENEKDDIYAVALKLKCSICEIAHKELMKKYDFVYDYDEYIPHITLSYKGKDVDISKLPVPDIFIKFDKLNVEPLDEDWANNNS